MNESNSYPQWLGLLKWSLSQTDPSGGGSDFTEMSLENREFLEAVMKDLVKDEPGELQKILSMFQEMIGRGFVEDDNDKVLDMLESTQEIIDQIDMANVFIKFGGAISLLRILQSDVIEDASKCASSVICGELAQNNPSAQLELLNHGLLDQLAVMCIQTSISNKLCSKTLFGISCIVRGSKEGEKRFFEDLAGGALLKRVLSRHDDACGKKVMFLANALLMSEFSSPHRLTRLASSILPDVFCYLDSEDVDMREVFLRLVDTIAVSPEGLKQLFASFSSLQSTLTGKLLTLVNDDDHVERQLIENILQKLDKVGKNDDRVHSQPLA
jgi:hypothetical protein